MTMSGLIFLFASITIVLAVDSDVFDLSSNDVSSFKNELASHDTILVEFFAPWCGHCKRLAPEYSRAATLLKENDPPVPLAKVDCTSDQGKDVCGEFGVSGYPTLKIFKGGEFSQEYAGPRDGEGIVKYMRSQVGPASKLFTSFGDLKEKLSVQKDVLVVGLFNSDKDDLYISFMKVANQLRDSVNFGHILQKDAEGDVKNVEALKGSSAPSVVLVRPAHMKNKFEESAVLYDNEGSLSEFVKTQFHGLCGQRTQNNMVDFKQPYVIAYYDVDYVKNPKGTNYWRNRVLKVAQSHPDIRFAISNSQMFAGELEEYGIEPSRDGRDAAPLIVARSAKSLKYKMTEKFSVDNLEAFVKGVKEETLEPYIKSEELPVDNSGGVKVAVGKNFDELVLKSKKDILIEFYAPWCGHCKKLAPAWEELGETLKDEPGVEIVKMDATANDVPAPFSVTGFPTIYFFPADSKQPKRYEGGRDANDFLEYIAKYATKELQGYGRDGKKKSGKSEL